MSKLPKDLEAKSLNDTKHKDWDESVYWSQGFDTGAQAVLEHEQIKKLEEALNYYASQCPEKYRTYCDDPQQEDWYPTIPVEITEVAVKALADFRAWVSGKTPRTGDGE